jgi:hypothetical protein
MVGDGPQRQVVAGDDALEVQLATQQLGEDLA